MKIYKVLLAVSSILLLAGGMLAIGTQIEEAWLKYILISILLFQELLNIGCYLYFRKRFVDFSDEVCQSAEHILQREKVPGYYNRETLTSKMVMELEKIHSIFEAQLSQSQQEKRKIQETISEISHQLKTPLSNIRMYHDMLSDPDMAGEDTEKFMEIIQQQLEKLEFLIDSLVKSSRLEGEMIKLCMEQSPIIDTLTMAVNEISKKAEQKNIEISIHCSQTASLSHDVKWTAEALANILENAVKYTPSMGKISIQTVLGEMYAEIKISDTGAGICPDHFQDIFKRFYRENNASRTEGLGLGLYIARNIIALEGGYILVRSALGQGSSFSVFLPNR